MTPEVNLSIEYENEENIIILPDLHSPDKKNLLPDQVSQQTVFSRERFSTVAVYRGFVTKSQLVETLFTRN